MLLTFDETAAELRSRVEAKELTAWNHYIHSGTGEDVWIICFLPGHHDPQTVEWSQASVERWIRDRDEQDALLRSL